jgi:hypothetical protein
MLQCAVPNDMERIITSGWIAHYRRPCETWTDRKLTGVGRAIACGDMVLTLPCRAPRGASSCCATGTPLRFSQESKIMWNWRKQAAMAIAGMGLAITAATSASACVDWGYTGSTAVAGLMRTRATPTIRPIVTAVVVATITSRAGANVTDTVSAAGSRFHHWS